MADNPFTVQVPNAVQALLIGQNAYDAGQKRQQAQALTDARQQATQAYQSGDAKGALATLLGAGDTQGAQLMGQQLQNDYNQKRNTVNDAFEHGQSSARLKLAQSAEGRAQSDFDNTPDQYAPNPRANEPGQPAYIDQYAAAKAAGEVAAPGGIKSLTPGGELYHLDEGGKVVIDHKNDKAANADDTPQSTIDFLADRTRLGDQRHLVGLSRVPGLIARVQTTADQRESAGIPISDQAKAVVGNQVTLSARGSAERKLGTINTNNEFYGNNALGAIDIAEKASAAVPRTNYPGVNAALNAYRTNTGDPATKAMGAALNTVINDYAKFTGGGVGTDALRGEAIKMLNGQDTHPQVQAVLNMMRTEIKRGQQSPGMVRGTFDDVYAPGGTGNGPRNPGTGQQFPQVTPAALDYLKKTGDMGNFDAMFGPGSAKRALSVGNGANFGDRFSGDGN